MLGGISVTDMTRRVLKEVMSHEVSLLFNWCGKKGKRKFGKLKLAQAILSNNLYLFGTKINILNCKITNFIMNNCGLKQS